MIVLLEQIGKSFGANTVLKDINIQIDEGQRVGLIGANGAGKSTLLNIINGDLEADSGTRSVGSGKRFGFLRQNSGLSNNKSIQEEMRSVFQELDSLEESMRADEKEMANYDPESLEYQKIMTRYSSVQQQYELAEGYQIQAKIGTVLNGMGFADYDWNTNIDVLSGGERTRLALSKLLLESPDLLILDEPTNHLDFPTLIWLEEYLATYKGSLLVVSHDRYFLDKICNHVWELEHHVLQTYSGNYSRYLIQKEERESLYRKEYEQQQEEIAKLEDFVARNLVRASTTKRAQSRRKILDKMERLDAPKAPPKPPSIRFEQKREPVSDVLQIEDLSLSVGENPRKHLFSNFNLHIKRGEKIAVVGHNGIGKSSMLKAIQNKIPHDSGTIIWGRNTDVSYFEQGEGEMDANKMVMDELWDEFPSESENSIRTVLGQAGLRGEEVYKKVGSLSGGERARLKFAKLMLQRGNVMLMDEPTNHLDLPTKEILDTALETYQGTLLVVSHDRYLLNKFPDKIVEVQEDGVEIYVGHYDDYILTKQNIPSADPPAVQEETPPPSTGKNTYRGKEERKRAAYRRQRLTQLETQIFDLEERISSLEQDVQDPAIMSDYQALEEKYQELDDLRQGLEEVLEEWTLLGEEEEEGQTT